MFRADIYPGDVTALKKVNLQTADVRPHWNDSKYIQTLIDLLSNIEDIGISFCLYVAGTDCLKGDKLCGLNISENGIIQRDLVVLKWCLKHNVKMAMTLAGGQSNSIGNLIGRSVLSMLAEYDQYSGANLSNNL